MKVYIWEDEVHPVYGIDTDPKYHRASDMVEIPNELYEHYKKVKLEYGEVQAELEKYY